MAPQILSWPAKRLAIARLTAYADGTTPPPSGAELLLADPPNHLVQVAWSLPAEPDRICIHGRPVRSVLREATAESPEIVAETAAVEIRVQVFEPGEDEQNVDLTLNQVCDAVVVALTTEPLTNAVRLWLAACTQEPTIIAGNAEPSVTGAAVLSFRAEAVAYGY